MLACLLLSFLLLSSTSCHKLFFIFRKKERLLARSLSRFLSFNKPPHLTAHVWIVFAAAVTTTTTLTLRALSSSSSFFFVCGVLPLLSLCTDVRARSLWIDLSVFTSVSRLFGCVSVCVKEPFSFLFFLYLFGEQKQSSFRIFFRLTKWRMGSEIMGKWKFSFVLVVACFIWAILNVLSLFQFSV